MPGFVPSKRFLSPPVFRDEQLNDVARLIYWISIAAVVVIVFFVPLLIVLSPGSAALLSAFVAGLVAVIFGSVWAVRSGRPLRGARIFVAGALVLEGWLVFVSGGTHSPIVSTLLVSIVLSGILLGWRDCLIVTAVVILALFGFAGAENLGLTMPAAWDTPLFRAGGTSAAGLLMALGVISSFRSMVTAVETARVANEGLGLAGKVYATTSEGIVVTTPEGAIVDVNDAYLRLSGYKRDEVIGRNPSMMQSGRHSAEFFAEMWATLLSTGGWQGEIWDKRADGILLPKWLSISTVKNEDGRTTHYVGVFSDITAIKKGEEDLQWLATHDPLTALPNRALLWDRLSTAVAHSRRYNSALAVLYFDLDHFKDVNDTLGHAMGDQLLVEIARRCLSVVRESDTFGRTGGDEFTVIATNYASFHDLRLLAERLLRAVEATVQLGESSALVTASIGIAVYPKDGADAAELATHADVAMYRAKALGKNRFELFDPAMQDDLTQRVEMETALREAVRADGLSLVYQPQVDLRTGLIFGIEALVRWQTPDGSTIMPDTFIPVAENSGLILELGEWVLKQACADMRLLRDEGHMLKMAINFSARQLMEQDVVRVVSEAVGAQNLELGDFEVEITESSIMTKAETAVAQINALIRSGVAVSIDDFGTGYASMSYVQQFHPDKIKIDRSFVTSVPRDATARAIINATIALGNGIGAIVLAEGAETEEQIRFLIGAGCDSAQCYYFSKPLPLNELQTLLKQGSFTLPSALPMA